MQTARWVDISGIQFTDEKSYWIQAYPFNTYTHPTYGEIKFDMERAQRMLSNLKNRVRGQDLDIDYDHKEKDTRAAGWIKDGEIRSDGLWIQVEFTETALDAVKKREFRYFSPEYADEWENPMDKKKYQDVLFGGALTNRPFLKDILPINLSELVNDKESGGTLDPMKEMYKLLGLPEDATPEQALEKVQAQSKGDPPKPEPKTEPEKEPETVTATEPPAEVKKFLEENPAVAAFFGETTKALTETFTKRISTLETANRLSEVNMQLSELANGKERVIAPASLEQIRDAVIGLPREQGDAVIKAFKEVVDKGVVELGEKGETKKGKESSTTHEFADKVDAWLKENSDKNYLDAVEAVQLAEPELAAAYRDAVLEGEA
jgi:hypothetical protein